jgi:FkbM family methyltransferase
MLRAGRRLSCLPHFKGRDRIVTGVLQIAGELRLEVEGTTYCLNPRDNVARSIALSGSLPSEIPSLLAEIAQPGMTVADIGASIGYTTIAMARAVGQHGRVFAFEPAALAYAQLCRNLAENGFEWVRAERSACSDAAGTAELNVAKVSTEYSSLAPCRRNLASRPETVRVVRLDDRIEGRLDVVKIDVEGAEWPVLRGIGDLLRSRPVLIVESLPENTQRFGYRPNEMFHWLRSFGYQFEWFTSDDVICR